MASLGSCGPKVASKPLQPLAPDRIFRSAPCLAPAQLPGSGSAALLRQCSPPLQRRHLGDRVQVLPPLPPLPQEFPTSSLSQPTPSLPSGAPVPSPRQPPPSPLQQQQQQQKQQQQQQQQQQQWCLQGQSADSPGPAPVDAVEAQAWRGPVPSWPILPPAACRSSLSVCSPPSASSASGLVAQAARRWRIDRLREELEKNLADEQALESQVAERRTLALLQASRMAALEMEAKARRPHSVSAPEAAALAVEAAVPINWWSSALLSVEPAAEGGAGSGGGGGGVGASSCPSVESGGSPGGGAVSLEDATAQLDSLSQLARQVDCLEAELASRVAEVAALSTQIRAMCSP